MGSVIYLSDYRRPQTVLFAGTHNAGLSQMAAGWVRHLAERNVSALSAGSAPAPGLDTGVVAAMLEIGIDITQEHPQAWTREMLFAADVVVTIGCFDTCPVPPGKQHEEWILPDPVGQDIDAIRLVRDQLGAGVQTLLRGLTESR